MSASLFAAGLTVPLAVSVSAGVTVGIAWALATASPLTGQSCSSLPSDENRLWVGARYVAGAAEGRVGLRLGFDFLNRVHLGAAYAFGGYDTGRGAATSRAGGVGVPVDLGSIDVCPTAFGEGTGYWFHDRFDADRGRVTDFRAGVRLPVAGPPMRRGSVEFRPIGAVAVAWRRLEFHSRTVEVDDGVSVEVDDALKHEAVVEGLLGVRLRTGSVGLTFGVANRVLDRRRFLSIVEFGVRAG